MVSGRASPASLLGQGWELEKPVLYICNCWAGYITKVLESFFNHCHIGRLTPVSKSCAIASAAGHLKILRL